MTANHEYSRSNRENLPLPFKCNYLKNHSPFFKLFITFLKSKLNFEHFENKNCASKLKYFWSYLLRKTCFLKCVKGPVSENPLAVNVLTSPKNCWNLQKSTFILLFHYFEQLELENVIFSQIWDFRTACYYVDCQLRVFS